MNPVAAIQLKHWIWILTTDSVCLVLVFSGSFNSILVYLSLFSLSLLQCPSVWLFFPRVISSLFISVIARRGVAFSVCVSPAAPPHIYILLIHITYKTSEESHLKVKHISTHRFTNCTVMWRWGWIPSVEQGTNTVGVMGSNPTRRAGARNIRSHFPGGRHFEFKFSWE